MKDKKYFIFLSILLITALLSGCQRYKQAGTYVWIDAPINNLSFPEPMPIKIEGHASSPGEISKVEIYIDGELLSTLNDLTQSGKLSIFETVWSPTTPGEHTIMAVSYSTSDQASEIDSVRIFFGESPPAAATEVPSLVVTPVFTFSPTPTGIVYTETPTTTPTATPTSTPTLTPTPGDTTPPAAPTPYVPANGLSLSCRATQSLTWLPVSDPSGIAEYRVNLQRSADNANWSNATGSPFTGIADKTIIISTECGWYYRWQVSAVDGAGNQSAWSSWSYFSITLE